MNGRDLFFILRYRFRGVPVAIDGREYRVAESLRRWDFSGERQVRDAIREHVAEGDTAVDVGANFGLHTLVLADRVGDSGRVFAFEPVPANLKLLRRNIRINSFDSRVAIVATAISDSTERFLEMRADSEGLAPTAALINSKESNRDPGVLRVANATLDRVPELGQCIPTFIKIDVEGAELGVLRGAENLLKQHRPTLLVEVHHYALPAFGDSAHQLELFLEHMGYRITQLSDMSSCNGAYYHILAKPGAAK